MKKEYSHGGNIFNYYEKYGKYPVDFSSNLNPLYSELCLEKKYNEIYGKCFIYPPCDYKLLREKIAEKEQVGMENICVTNGASELIRFIPLAFKSDTSLICSPAFSEYDKSLYNKNINKYRLQKENNFILGSDYLNYIKNNNMIFLTNPDNPVGNIIKYEFMCDIVKEAEKYNTFVVVDECFMDLCSENNSVVDLIDKFHNIIIIKAFTKTYSLAGLRLGYGISAAENINKLEMMLPEWRVSFPAYECGIEVLKNRGFIEKSKSYISQEKQYLIDNFKLFDFKIYGSYANYVFFYCSIANLDKRLEQYGILIRNCNNYNGLSDGYYRVAVKKHNENEILLKALKDIING